MSDSDSENGFEPMPGGEPQPECPVSVEERGVDVSTNSVGGVFKKITCEGSGDEMPPKGFDVIVHYTGRLLTGEVFDSSVDRNEPFKFQIGKGSVIKAWDQGVASMRRGEKCVLLCSPSYAYGARGSPPKIPANSWLSFEVELLDWEEPLMQMSKERKLEKAAQRREAGNTSFKSAQFADAQRHYAGALTILDGVFGGDAETLAADKAALHSNAAACALKLSQFSDALKSADSALKLQPRHTKALFRRGVAALELGELQTAKVDLAAALQLATEASNEPEAVAIRQAQARLKTKLQAEVEKQKKLYGGWLQSKPAAQVVSEVTEAVPSAE